MHFSIDRTVHTTAFDKPVVYTHTNAYMHTYINTHKYTNTGIHTYMHVDEVDILRNREITLVCQHKIIMLESLKKK